MTQLMNRVRDRAVAPVQDEPASSVDLPLIIGNERADTPRETVWLLTRYLAGQCDGAHTPDGHGFNKVDAVLGHKLAELPFEAWSPRQLWAARKILVRYRNTQLKEWWSVVPEIAEPAKDSESQRRDDNYAKKMREKVGDDWKPQDKFRRLAISQVNGVDVIEFQQSFDQRLVDALKVMPQRKYDMDRKVWYVPLHLDSMEPALDFALEWGYEVPDSVHERCSKILAEQTERIALSHASDADFVVPGLAPGVELRDFQKAGVKYASQVGNVMIADEMGLGKTIQGLAAIEIGNQYPAIVVCPASLKRNWEREVGKFFPKRSVVVLGSAVHPLQHRDGSPAFDIVVINYNISILRKWHDNLVALNPQAIICDEAHALKNAKSQQSKQVEKLIKETSARRIFLSGTPVVNRPMEFYQLVKLLGYDKALGGYNSYKARYDNKDLDRLKELNSRVRTMFFVRRQKKDVLKELPDKVRVTVPLPLRSEKAYREAESDIAHFFATKKSEDTRFLSELREASRDTAQRLGVDFDEVFNRGIKQHYTASYNIAAQHERLLRWEALKQVAVREKMPAVIDWIGEFLEDSDQKLVVFCLHVDIINQIVKSFPQFKAVCIHGGIKPDERLPIVDQFQNDPDCRLIVGHMQAMGEGLTLTAASNVAFIEFGWNPKAHSQAEDRCHRIGQKDSVTVYSLIAEMTIDEEIVDMIEEKRQVVDAIQDGAGADSQRAFMDDLQKRMDAKKAA